MIRFIVIFGIACLVGLAAFVYRVKYDSGPLEIGFQARYLNDITDQIGEQVEFRFSDGAAPTVVQDAADASGLYVLMPMRV